MRVKWLLLLLVGCVPMTFAHGLLARVRATGETIVGTAYYSSGEVAGGQWVEVFDVTAGGEKVAEFAADANGGFRHPGKAGHRYRLEIHGDEGHSIELEISLASGARASLVDSADAPEESSGPPAWAVVGGVLLLVSIVAVPFKLRTRSLSPRRYT